MYVRMVKEEEEKRKRRLGERECSSTIPDMGSFMYLRL
jgi:hypothetical protein